MQATVNLATETALVRAALPESDQVDNSGPHGTRLQALGNELAQVKPHTLIASYQWITLGNGL